MRSADPTTRDIVFVLTEWLQVQRLGESSLYSGFDALRMGLVNQVVSAAELDEEVGQWCQELLAKSPTALRMIKHSFQAETDGVAGITNLGVSGLRIYYGTEESLEGARAFMEKRKPDFSKYR